MYVVRKEKAKSRSSKCLSSNRVNCVGHSVFGIQESVEMSHPDLVNLHLPSKPGVAKAQPRQGSFGFCTLWEFVRRTVLRVLNMYVHVTMCSAAVQYISYIHSSNWNALKRNLRVQAGITAQHFNEGSSVQGPEGSSPEQRHAAVDP